MIRSLLRSLRPALLGWALVTCGSSSQTGPEPEVALASSERAQSEFRALRQRWVMTPLDARVGLERPLTAFVQRHPTDPQGRVARIYLAWISLQRGQLELADQWAALAEPGSAGSARDLLQVVRAGLLLSRGQAEQAYQDLLELQGRLIDDDDHLLCLDQLVLSALESNRHREATLHILELAAQAARRHRERMWRTLEPRLKSIPLPVLEASLSTLSQAPSDDRSVRPAEHAAAVDWMRRQILELLSHSALEQRDVELAQRLVSAPAARHTSESNKNELMLLATRGALAPLVASRTLGLALQTADAASRQRSVDVAAGIANALDLTEGERHVDPIVLTTRQVEPVGVRETLARLAGEGAALLVGGFDPPSAREAAEFSRERGVPVLLLHEPAPGPELPASVWIIGADDAAANRVLRSELGRRAEVISVGAPETPCPAAGASDKLPALRRVSPRGLPLAVCFESSAECARSVLMSLSPAESPALIGLGLNALTALGDELASGAEIWALGAGRLPHFEGSRDAALTRWFDTRGRAPGWYAALGHDAALLAELALPKSKAAIVRDAEQVAAIHEQVASGLARSMLSDLWTSDGGSFDAAHRLSREFRVVRLPARGGARR